MKEKRFKSKILFLSLLIIISGLLGQPAFASTAKETFTKTIPFSPGGYLNLSNINGDVEIQAWERNEIEIIAYKEVKASERETAEKLLEKLVIIIEEKEGEVIIKTDYPRNSSGGDFFGWLFGESGKSFSVQYEIKVPKQVDLNIETTNGDVEVENIAGRLKLESTNGQISGREISGQSRCKTTNGSIKMEFTEISGDDKMTFKSTNGSIKLYLPDDFGADVDLKTTNGRISSDFPFTGQKSKTHFSGTIIDNRNELSCSTTNGNIDLRKR